MEKKTARVLKLLLKSYFGAVMYVQYKQYMLCPSVRAYDVQY